MQTGLQTNLISVQQTHILRLRPPADVHQVVGHPVILVQVAVAVRLDGGVMDKGLLAAAVGDDEAVALFTVEPFNGPCEAVGFGAGGAGMVSWFGFDDYSCFVVGGKRPLPLP